MPDAKAQGIIDPGGPYGLRIFQDFNMAHLWGTLTVKAGTYPQGGIEVDWGYHAVPPGGENPSTLRPPAFNPGPTPSSAMQPIPSDNVPYRVNFYPGGKDTYRFQWKPGKVELPLKPGEPPPAGKVQIFSSSGSELSGSIPSAITEDDELKFEVIVQRS